MGKKEEIQNREEDYCFGWVLGCWGAGCRAV